MNKRNSDFSNLSVSRASDETPATTRLIAGGKKGEESFPVRETATAILLTAEAAAEKSAKSKPKPTGFAKPTETTTKKTYTQRLVERSRRNKGK